MPDLNRWRPIHANRKDGNKRVKPLSHWGRILLRSFPIYPIVKFALERDKVLKKVDKALGSVVISRPAPD